MQILLLSVHILAAIGLISLVLIQHGKGADAGAAFGAGASATVFGSRGSGSFLTRMTAILAAVFFVTSLWLAYFSGRSAAPRSVVDQVAVPEQSAPVRDDVPALPAAPAAGQPVGDLPPPAVTAPESPEPVDAAPAAPESVVPAAPEAAAPVADAPAIEAAPSAETPVAPAPAADEKESAPTSGQGAGNQ